MDVQLNPGPTSSSSRSKWKRPCRGCQSGRTVRAREATKVFQYSARHDTSSSPICISLLTKFCQKVGFNSVTGSSHDGFIVLCSTQIMKGFEGSKRGKGRGWTNFGLICSCTGEEGFQELNLMCDWERSRVLSLNNIWTMLLNNFFANYVCRDGISIKLVPRVLPV